MKKRPLSLTIHSSVPVKVAAHAAPHLKSKINFKLSLGYSVVENLHPFTAYYKSILYTHDGQSD